MCVFSFLPTRMEDTGINVILACWNRSPFFYFFLRRGKERNVCFFYCWCKNLEQKKKGMLLTGKSTAFLWRIQTNWNEIHYFPFNKPFTIGRNTNQTYGNLPSENYQFQKIFNVVQVAGVCTNIIFRASSKKKTHTHTHTIIKQNGKKTIKQTNTAKKNFGFYFFFSPLVCIELRHEQVIWTRPKSKTSILKIFVFDVGDSSSSFFYFKAHLLFPPHGPQLSGRRGVYKTYWGEKEGGVHFSWCVN